MRRLFNWYILVHYEFCFSCLDEGDTLEGESKVIYLPKNANYKIEIIATDIGLMNYSLQLIGEDGVEYQRSNIYNVSLTKDKVFEININNNTGSNDYQDLVEKEGDTVISVIQPDEILSANDLGSVSIYILSPVNGTVFGSGEYSKGDYVQLYATPDTGYIFDGWYENGIKLDSSKIYSLNADKNMLIEAVFKASKTTVYNITATAGTGGSIFPSSSISVTEGNDQTFSITANSGYRISDVLVDGQSIGTKSSYTFNNVTADHTISATFIKTSSSSSSTTTPGTSSGSSSSSSSSSSGSGSTGGSGNNTNTGGSTNISFTDVSEADWFYDSVAFVVEKGLFDGMGDGTFAPKKAVTREMFVTVLGRLAETLGVSTIGYDNTFTDVPSGMWYSNYIAWGAANGLLEGYDSDTFGLGRSITREQMATLLVRFAEYVNVTLDGNASVQFTDASNIRAYAIDAVDTCSKAGLINGYDDGTFRPSGNATRADVATIFMRFMKQYIS